MTESPAINTQFLKVPKNMIWHKTLTDKIPDTGQTDKNVASSTSFMRSQPSPFFSPWSIDKQPIYSF